MNMKKRNIKEKQSAGKIAYRPAEADVNITVLVTVCVHISLFFFIICSRMKNICS